MQPSAADSLFGRAEGLRRKNRYQAAIPVFRAALSRYRRVNDLPGVLNCQLALGDLGRMLGAFEIERARLLANGMQEYLFRLGA